MHVLFCDIGVSIRSALDTFMYSICTFIYGLIIDLYNVFDLLCQGRLLDSDLMQAISFRVSLILGLLMFFRVVFSFIQYLVNPDTITDKEKGAFNLVSKILIVIVLLGTYSYIFDFAFKVQNFLLGSNEDNVNVISRLLLPEVVDSDNFGGVLSSELFLTFYNLNDSLIPESYHDETDYMTCVEDRRSLGNDIIEYGEFNLGYECLDDKYTLDIEDNSVRIIKFNSFLAPIVGIFVAWILLMYCFSVGVRIIQFAFLEIIAPVAIISYLAPGKDNAFQKWLKMCTTTYFDVFIRVAIINFIVLIIAQIINGFNSSQGAFWESMLVFGNPSVVSSSMGFIKVVMILALLTFAKKAPELIKELLPKSMVASGDFGFSLKKRLDNMVGGKVLQNGLKKLPSTASRAIGFGLGGITGAAVSGISRYNAQKLLNRDEKTGDWQDGGRRKAILGMLGGVGSGLVHGAQGGMKKGNLLKNVSGVVDERRKSDNDYVSLVNAGGSIIGRTAAKFADTFGESRGSIDKRKLDNANLVKQSVDSIEKLAESTSHFKTLDHLKGHLEREPGETDANYLTRIQLISEQMDNYKEAFVQAALRGEEFVDYQYRTMEMQTKKVKVGQKAKMVTEDVFEVREVDTGIFNPDTGKNFTRKEKVKVGTKEVASTTEFEDVFEDRVEWVEVAHDTSAESSTVTLTGGDKTKASQIITEVGNLTNEINTRNISLVQLDEHGNKVERIPIIPDASDDKAAKTILDLTKDVRRTETAVKGAEGYMAGQANMSEKKGK